MKKENNIPKKFNSISELHQALGFPKPLHPLVSLVNYADIKTPAEELPKALLLNFFKISYKKSLTGKIKYGQHYYDFDEGGLSFVSPNQIISSTEDEKDYSGYTLLIHPDFLRNYSLGTKIKSFGYFSYSVNEALFLSDKEKQVIFTVFENIKEELNNTIDDFSQDVMVSHIEVLLHYSNRFYKRQFLTRKTANSDLLSQMEQLLADYFEKKKAINEGLLTVEYLAYQLHLSPRYLSDMLRSLTGQNAQHHIHEKVIEKAKEYLTTSNITVAEVAYLLGFEHPQSFSKLFKKKTNQTPVQFKELFQQN
ncbi:helix-turn-helix domain-containing protein [Flavobacterium sp. GA093]|uniref:Helix-turn-helix domain-containing protein n=1 Tax=Flavobacterium hydrocarbonoxydans TaxID=2683249 RepID=A0A6I4NIY7_9FLAO|nr:response regulator transcription factor [Flavobacterium hydrocarbonoxydans]MWB94338.1 helix-turn-helix domain-containing protein [Flavobacterium hydrocarbonoxydans]